MARWNVRFNGPTGSDLNSVDYVTISYDDLKAVDRFGVNFPVATKDLTIAVRDPNWDGIAMTYGTSSKNFVDDKDNSYTVNGNERARPFVAVGKSALGQNRVANLQRAPGANGPWETVKTFRESGDYTGSTADLTVGGVSEMYRVVPADGITLAGDQ